MFREEGLGRPSPTSVDDPSHDASSLLPVPFAVIADGGGITLAVVLIILRAGDGKEYDALEEPLGFGTAEAEKEIGTVP